MQMLTKTCRKSENSLSFSYENTVTEGTCSRSKQWAALNFFSLAQIDELYHEL